MRNESKVWFVPVEEGASPDERVRRLGSVIDRSGKLDEFPNGGVATVKMHFGEEGNRGYVRPELVRCIADATAARGGRTVVADTNTLYRGRRTNSRDHLALAREHGFTDEAVGGSVVIPDETNPADVAAVPVAGGRFITTARVMRQFVEAQFLIGLAHFKGHIVAGFGGAIKNIGMGCAAREGKLAQHSSVAPYIIMKNCIGCGACRDICPQNAISLVTAKAVLDPQKCIGCASCIAVCKSDAVELDWSGGAGSMPEKMVEYTSAVLSASGQKLFINIVTGVTAECDCMATDDPAIVPDVGMLLSNDPVAVDQASYDLVCRKAGGYDPFRKAHPRRDPLRQLDYAERMGLGTRRYELLTIGDG
jgi:uncharacterized Fe-S center protein